MIRSTSVNPWNPRRVHIKGVLASRSISPPPDMASRPSIIVAIVASKASTITTVSGSMISSPKQLRRCGADYTPAALPFGSFAVSSTERNVDCHKGTARPTMESVRIDDER